MTVPLLIGILAAVVVGVWLISKLLEALARKEKKAAEEYFTPAKVEARRQEWKGFRRLVRGGISTSALRAFALLIAAVGAFALYMGTSLNFWWAIVLGTVLVCLALTLAVMATAGALRRTAHWWVYLLLWAMALPALFAPLYVHMQQGLPSTAILAAASGVSEAGGVQEAAAYSSGHSPHPVVLVLTGGDADGLARGWSGRLPHEWCPKDVESTELVLFVGEEQEEVLQTCLFIGQPNNENVTGCRVVYRRDVRLREMRTGELVAADAVRGEPPREFREKETPARDEDGDPALRLYGAHVTTDDVVTWLAWFAEDENTWSAGGQ